MARKVKCVYCGATGTNEEFYKVPKTNKPTNFLYYCSVDEYEMYMKVEEEKLAEKEAQWIEREINKQKKQEETKQRQDLIDYISYELLEYQHGMQFPTYITKRIKELREFYTYAVIKESFVRGEETIKWAIQNKDFGNEYGKCRYIMTIAEGSINDVFKEWQEREQQHIQSEERFSQVDLIDEIDAATFVKKKEKESIVAFLGEDEM